VTENIFNNDGTLEVYQTIVTNEQKHKAIIIGKGGKVLKKLIARVSPDIEKILDAKITLKLFVKVKENWVEHWDEE
jgi:GTP-binding protein Era